MGQAVTLVGCLGQDVNVIDAEGHKKVAFSLATNEVTPKGIHTEWHRIVAWDSLAEICGKYASKGRLLELHGVIRRSEFKDKLGNNRVAYEIVAHRIQFLDAAPKLEAPVAEPKPAAVAVQPPKPVAPKPEPEVDPEVILANEECAPEEEAPAPKRRGRPPGSKNGNGVVEAKPVVEESEAPTPKRRGRPPGSKNKPKETPAALVAPVATPHSSSPKKKSSVASEDDIEVMNWEEDEDVAVAEEILDDIDDEEVGW